MINISTQGSFDKLLQKMEARLTKMPRDYEGEFLNGVIGRTFGEAVMFDDALLRDMRERDVNG